MVGPCARVGGFDQPFPDQLPHLAQGNSRSVSGQRLIFKFIGDTQIERPRRLLPILTID